MADLKLLPGQIYRGNYDAMKEALEKSLPKDAKLYLEDEPYCNIQSRSAVRTLKLVMDDPRFVFDDLFIGRQLYFSASPSRDAVMSHPRFPAVALAYPSFTEYMYKRYGENAGMTHVGMAQRYYQADRAIQQWKRDRNIRLVFFLYPALIRHIRSFKQRYYAPGGLGYTKALANFTSLAHKHDTFFTISV
jgi:hypothetical protein